jgi:hypothetical protein
MLTNDTCPETCGKRAWYTVGPGLLTKLLETGKYPDFSVFPSYSFIPYHFTGLKYEGHKKVYCFQEWGSTKQNYEIMNQLDIPEDLKTPKEWVSVLVSSYNTKYLYIKECLESIKSQTGHFGIELVWINDGSDYLNSKLLERELDNFKKTTRFTKLIYEKYDENRGIDSNRSGPDFALHFDGANQFLFFCSSKHEHGAVLITNINLTINNISGAPSISFHIMLPKFFTRLGIKAMNKTIIFSSKEQPIMNGNGAHSSTEIVIAIIIFVSSTPVMPDKS